MWLPLLLSGFLLFGAQASAAAVVPPAHAKAKPVPPGLAKKGGLPPGLAKKFGRRIPERPYIAFDPARPDRAWLLIEGQWRLKTGFTATLRAEVQESLKRPSVPPPVPLPRIGVDLHVVLFE